jgi:hypothetical protein
VRLLLSRKVIYCSFPYFGPASEAMSRELKVLFNRYFPNVNLHIVLVNNFIIGSFFRCKDMLPVHMPSSLVYQYCCARCACAYVGMTSRNLYSRVSEHKGRSCRTGQLHTNYAPRCPFQPMEVADVSYFRALQSYFE